MNADAQSSPILIIAVEDDGVGLFENQRVEAIKRGKRLDESRPGSGLGLSIVDDIVSEYGGSIELAKSAFGGLKVIIQLPANQ